MFADKKLQRSGRCHESELFNAFRRSYARYRSAEVLPDSTLRDMVRNWHPGVERTRMGYLRNISLQTPVGVGVVAGNSVAGTGRVEGSLGSQDSSGSDLLDNIAAVAAEENNKARVNMLDSSVAVEKQPTQN